MTEKEIYDIWKKAEMFKEMTEKKLKSGEYLNFDSDEIESALRAYIASLRVIGELCDELTKGGKK